RDEEIQGLWEVLNCRAVKHAVLVGEPGVGKRSIVRGLVQKATNRRLVSMDLAVLLLHVKNPDQRWEAIKASLGEARRVDVVLFWDGWLSLAVAEAPGNAAKALLALLPWCGARCILTATPEEFQSYLKQFPVLQGVLEPVLVQPLSAEATLGVLRSL